MKSLNPGLTPPAQDLGLSPTAHVVAAELGPASERAVGGNGGATPRIGAIGASRRIGMPGTACGRNSPSGAIARGEIAMRLAAVEPAMRMPTSSAKLSTKLGVPASDSL
ncbi:MAG: hypothetical protein ACKV2Q_11125 [Planctomycetaceae bacterium]